jgi:exodeoxyribonuclease V alpha subunit
MDNEGMDSIELSPKQEEAVNDCCDISKRVVGVTGPAGTGKTTIIRKVYNQVKQHGYTPVLAAPTGKAAKRIYEATGIDAMTLHRLLEYTHPGDPDPKTGKPKGFSWPRRDRQNRLEYDFILIDEAMMMNEELHRALFDAIPIAGVIRYFGDANQLSPVEEFQKKDQVQPPPPFVRLLNDKSGKFKVITLDTIYRQGKDSGILFNCERILKGSMPTKNDQWTMQFTDLTVDALRQYVLESMNEGVDWNVIENQIIVPQNKGGVGRNKLNIMLQGLYNNESNPCLYLDRLPWVAGEGDKKGGTIRVFVGDKVIISSNLYDLGVFNGESGVIIHLDQDTGEVTIDFGDREQTIPPILQVVSRDGNESVIDPRKYIDLGYCITTHKSQGSEYQRVCYVMNKSNYWMLNRRNFYTATSRAKEHVHIITDQKGLFAAISKKD